MPTLPIQFPDGSWATVTYNKGTSYSNSTKVEVTLENKTVEHLTPTELSARLNLPLLDLRTGHPYPAKLNTPEHKRIRQESKVFFNSVADQTTKSAFRAYTTNEGYKALNPFLRYMFYNPNNVARKKPGDKVPGFSDLTVLQAVRAMNAAYRRSECPHIQTQDTYFWRGILDWYGVDWTGKLTAQVKETEYFEDSAYMSTSGLLRVSFDSSTFSRCCLLKQIPNVGHRVLYITPVSAAGDEDEFLFPMGQTFKVNVLSYFVRGNNYGAGYRFIRFAELRVLNSVDHMLTQEGKKEFVEMEFLAAKAKAQKSGGLQPSDKELKAQAAEEWEDFALHNGLYEDAVKGDQDKKTKARLKLFNYNRVIDFFVRAGFLSRLVINNPGKSSKDTLIKILDQHVTKYTVPPKTVNASWKTAYIALAKKEISEEKKEAVEKKTDTAEEKEEKKKRREELALYERKLDNAVVQLWALARKKLLKYFSRDMVKAKRLASKLNEPTPTTFEEAFRLIYLHEQAEAAVYNPDDDLRMDAAAESIAPFPPTTSTARFVFEHKGAAIVGPTKLPALTADAIGAVWNRISTGVPEVPKQDRRVIMCIGPSSIDLKRSVLSVFHHMCREDRVRDYAWVDPLDVLRHTRQYTDIINGRHFMKKHLADNIGPTNKNGQYYAYVDADRAAGDAFTPLLHTVKSPGTDTASLVDVALSGNRNLVISLPLLLVPNAATLKHIASKARSLHDDVYVIIVRPTVVTEHIRRANKQAALNGRYLTGSTNEQVLLNNLALKVPNWTGVQYIVMDGDAASGSPPVITESNILTTADLKY